MNRKVLRGVVFAAVTSLALASCSDGSDSDDAGKQRKGATSESEVLTAYNPQPAKNIKQGGSVTLPITEIPDQLNNFQGNASLYTGKISWFYTPNMSYNDAKGNVTFNKDFLTDVEEATVDGNTQITYDINPEATWNDGTDFDWTVFRDTWKALNGKNKDYSVGSTDGYSSIASVEKGENADQAIVTFDGRYVWWEILFPHVLHPEMAGAKAFNEAMVDDPHPEWGAGPFTIDKFDPKGGTVSFKPNPKWWGAEPKLDRFTFVQMEDSASINAFKNGEIDSTEVSTAERLNQVKSMKGIDIRRGTTTANSLLVFNSTSPVLEDLEVRKALMQGIDRAQLAEISFQGLNYTEPLPGSFLLFPFQEGYQDNFGNLVKFDPKAAKKGLEKAGWKAGDGNIRSKGGKKLTVDYVLIGDNPVTKARVTAMAQMLKNIGVKLNIKNRPSADFAKVFSERSFDIFGMGFISSDPYGMAYICQMYCSDSTLNVSRSTPKSMDKEVKAVSKLPTAEKQITAGNKVEVKAMKTYGIMPLSNGPTIIATKKGLANYGSAQFYGHYGTLGPPELIGWEK